METIIRSFYDVTALGPFWTPVFRIGLVTWGFHQLVVVVLTLLRDRMRSWVTPMI